MSDPCLHATPGSRLHWLVTHDPRYRARCGDAPVRLPCTHEGAILEFAACKCEGRHVRDCDVHDRCTRAAGGPLACCAACPDYEAPA